MRFYCICFLIFLSCSTQKQDRVQPQERDLTESVYASLTIQPDTLYFAYASVSGLLDEIYVEEGDSVKAEQGLFQIKNLSPELNAQNALLSLELAEANYQGSAALLKAIEDEIRAAFLKHKNDSLNYFRQEKLWRQGIGSQVQLETKTLNYELAQNNLNLLQSKYDRTKQELETAFKQAKNKYKDALTYKEDFSVKSKIKGKVYAVYKEVGELINATEPLASIGSRNHFIIEMLVDEVDIVRISKTQEVLLSIDAYKDQVFSGSVSKIYPKKDEQYQTFTVEAVFKDAPEVLYPGLSGEANIIISKKSRVLSIPKTYLINGNSVKTDEGLVLVTKGLENMEYVEILSGISKDTFIYNPE